MANFSISTKGIQNDVGESSLLGDYIPKLEAVDVLYLEHVRTISALEELVMLAVMFIDYNSAYLVTKIIEFVCDR